MFKPKTVLVLGAGLSAEIGLPIGSQLLSDIRSSLISIVREEVSQLSDALNQLPNGRPRPEKIKDLLISCGAYPSIDALLEQRGHTDPEITDVAKLAIVDRIIRAERESLQLLHTGKKNGSYDNFSSLTMAGSGSFKELFHIATSGMGQQGNLAERVASAFSRLSIVTFNYDRVLEYTFGRLLPGLGLNAADTDKVLRSLNIIHAYGSFGEQLSGLSGRAGPEVPFGFEGGELSHMLVRGHTEIRTFSEQLASGVDKLIKAALADASQIIFLGCAFHSQNLSLLEPEVQLPPSTTIFGTYFNDPPPYPDGTKPNVEYFSEPDRRYFHSQLRGWCGGGEVNIEPLICSQLIRKYALQWREQ